MPISGQPIRGSKRPSAKRAPCKDTPRCQLAGIAAQAPFAATQTDWSASAPLRKKSGTSCKYSPPHPALRLHHCSMLSAPNVGKRTNQGWAQKPTELVPLEANRRVCQHVMFTFLCLHTFKGVPKSPATSLLAKPSLCNLKRVLQRSGQRLHIHRDGFITLFGILCGLPSLSQTRSPSFVCVRLLRRSVAFF